ncbi:HNH endonuclease [bacterium]|nr:HNH endonuclease [bacterium]
MKFIKGIPEAEYKRIWRENNKDRVLASKKRSYEKNKDSILKANSEYRQENYERRIEIERASRERNRDKNRPSKNARQSVRNRLVSSSKYVIIYKDLKRIYSQPCFNCGSMNNQSLDHRIPLSRGGEHKIGNMLTLCQPCNASKHSKTIMEWKLSKIKKGDD